jgi:hypothetical protein
VPLLPVALALPVSISQVALNRLLYVRFSSRLCAEHTFSRAQHGYISR